MKGRPLRCRACEGTLILNALALRQHLSSKRHKRGMKGGTWLLRLCPKPATIIWGHVPCDAGRCSKAVQAAVMPRINDAALAMGLLIADGIDC